MKGKKCRVCGITKAVNQFYATGKRSRRSGEKLFHGACKECYNILQKHNKRVELSSLCVDERHTIVESDPRYRRERVREALRRRGLRK